MTALDIKTTDGRREAWIVICGMPTESEQCPVHRPEEES